MVASGTNLTRSLEDYLEAVFVLIRREGAARVRDIAAETKVSKSSVTAALKHLAEAGLVHYDPYQLVRLTPAGKALAEGIRRKHNALRKFLLDVLDVDVETAEENACRMEHVIDENVLRRLSLLGEFLESCPVPSEEWLEEFSAYCRRRESQAGDVPQTG
jgi:DtxR family Mn-dependent transcriptional regulator